MLFQTPTFLIFLILFIAGFWITQGRTRTIYTCFASYLFYGWWFPPYTVVLLLLTLYAYYFGMKPVESSVLMAGVILLGLSPLLVFKYTDFVLENIELISGFAIGLKPNWLLPIGISFITFTAIAYIIDVRRKQIVAETEIWNIALFISFFPQLVAGPILRGNELLSQLKTLQINTPAIKAALFLFAVGAVKKVGIADQLAPVVDKVYRGTNVITLPDALLAFYGFAIQIYGDFSGYTDMALALALLFCVKLPKNFDRPYLAISVRQFWRCWHMTLSRWLRDYLYIPLGGSKNGIQRTLGAILITMVLGGLWHGAAWTFVIWGLLHGLFIAFEHWFELRRGTVKKLPRSVKIFLVFHLVCASWIFFRAPNIERAIDVFKGFLIPGDFAIIWASPLVPLLIVGTLLLHPLDSYKRVVGKAESLPTAVVVPLSMMLILICSALASNNPSAFIYFDF